MTSDDLTAAQARQSMIGSGGRWIIWPLRNRMVTLRFKSDDPLFRLTQAGLSSSFSIAGGSTSNF